MKKKIVISAFGLLLTLCVFSIPPVEEGKALFTTRCASCHNVNKVVVGPALAGVSERHTEDWIVHFVHSSQTLIKGGDKPAIDLYEKFNKVPMPDHTDLSAG
jgi:cytochrome c2